MITSLPGPEDVQFRRHKRTGKHRVRIALDKHNVRLFLHEDVFDSGRDLAGLIGFGERGFDLFCWLSRVLVSPAGSIGFVETLKRSRYIHPEMGKSPHCIPRTFVASGGHCSTPLYSPKGRALSHLSTVRHKNQISAEKRLKFMGQIIICLDF